MKNINVCYYCKRRDLKCISGFALFWCYLLLVFQPLLLFGRSGKRTECLGGGNSYLSSRAFTILAKNCSFPFSPVSWRYQKAAEEATAEKKRSVSICFLGNKNRSATCNASRTDQLHAVLLWRLIWWISNSLPCILQQTWLRRSVCFWLAPPALSRCEWKGGKPSALPTATCWVTGSLLSTRSQPHTWIFTAGGCVVPLPFLTKLKSLLKWSCQPLGNLTCVFDGCRMR